MLTLLSGTPPSKPGIENPHYPTESSVHVRIPKTELHIHTHTHCVSQQGKGQEWTAGSGLGTTEISRPILVSI